MIQIRPPLLLFPSLRPIEPSFPLQEAVGRVARTALTELAVSIALGALCCAFSAPGSIALIAPIVAFQWIMNTAIRIAIAYFEVQAKTDPGFKPPEAAHWIAPMNFARASLENGQTLVHEMGHAVASMALLENSCPKVELFPYKGGVTQFYLGEPSALGRLVGRKAIHPLIAAAGPGLTLGLSALFLADGLKLRKQKPELSRILIVAALIDFLRHALYAFSALYSDRLNLAHDFMLLWMEASIHPIAAMIAILAIPILILSVNKAFDDANCARENTADKGHFNFFGPIRCK